MLGCVGTLSCDHSRSAACSDDVRVVMVGVMTLGDHGIEGQSAIGLDLAVVMVMQAAGCVVCVCCSWGAATTCRSTTAQGHSAGPEEACSWALHRDKTS